MMLRPEKKMGEYIRCKMAYQFAKHKNKKLKIQKKHLIKCFGILETQYRAGLYQAIV
jgi:hypothetical protein